MRYIVELIFSTIYMHTRRSIYHPYRVPGVPVEDNPPIGYHVYIPVFDWLP